MERFTLLDAVAAPLPADNIDTDQVIPARFIQKPRANDFGQWLFLDVRRAAAPQAFVLDRPAYAGARILVAGRNFGCGSSREHAVWALQDGGIRAVIAPSFGDIFHGNALKNGLLPITLPADAVARLLQALDRAPGSHLRIDLAAQTVQGPDPGAVHFDIDAFAKQCLLEGLDELSYTLGRIDQIRQFEERMQA